MKFKKTLLIIVALVCMSFLFFGCAPQAGSQQQIQAKAASVEPPAPAARQPSQVQPALKTEQPGTGEAGIRFESTVYDFGDVGPRTKNTGEFKFKNTGTSLLKITSVRKTCGCTPFSLKKKEYAPGEAGTLKFAYHASGARGKATRHIFVSSNDKDHPKISLTIKADIVLKVDVKPRILHLSLRKEKAGAQKIVLTANDDTPFSIKRFQSTNNAITIDFDPQNTATEFVFEPKVDMEKLKKRLSGNIDIRLTHPQCDRVSLSYKTPAEFESVPKAIVVTGIKPLKPVEKTIYIKNNYGDSFEIESVNSEKGIVKLIDQKKVGNQIKLNLLITGPQLSEELLHFSDTLYVNIKGAQRLEIRCRGFYSAKTRNKSKS